MDDERYTLDAPLGAWAYFGYSLLYSITVIGFIIAIIDACSRKNNVHKRTHARAVLIIIGIAFILNSFLAIVGTKL